MNKKTTRPQTNVPVDREAVRAAPAPVPAQETQSSGQQERQGADTHSHAEQSHPLWWITAKPAEPEPEPAGS